MALGAALARLWRRPAFRRLLTVRVLSQAADGTLLVGMASYVLFSPQNQPNAWAIAGVLALTLLPFTVLGPFVSTFLDRWSRRQVVVLSDAARATLSAGIGLLIATGSTGGGWDAVLFGALLVAMSINRFMLAGLSAGMQHTVAEDEYLSASSILPMVGPLGVVIGGLLGFVSRAGLGGLLGVDGANAVVFFVAAALFAGSVATALGFRRDALGPEPGHPRTTARQVLAGLVSAVRHVGQRPAAGLGLATMAGTRFLFGLLTAVAILAYRNLFHPGDPTAALGQLTVWGVLTGVGFILATALVPVLARRLGLRRTLIAMALVGAIASGVLVFVATPLVLNVASFVIGLSVQSVKICVDTLVQAHVDEVYKGRAFILYDVLFNTAFVLAAVVAAVALPETGLSVPGFVAMALLFALLAAGFAVAAGRIGAGVFEKGTEDLTGRSAG